MVLMIVFTWGAGDVIKSAGDDEVSMMWSLVFGVLALTLNLFTWGLAILLKSMFVRDLLKKSFDCLNAACLAFVSFFIDVACFEDLDFLVVVFPLDIPFLILRFGGFRADCFFGEIEKIAGALEDPGWSTCVECGVDSDCVSHVSALNLRLSSKQKFLIFRLFWLYSPTVLHATKFIRRKLGSSAFCTRFVVCVVSYGFAVSFDMEMSFFLFTLFFLLFVSVAFVLWHAWLFSSVECFVVVYNLSCFV